MKLSKPWYRIGWLVGILVIFSSSPSIALEGIVFIINEKNPVIKVSHEDVRDFYMRKKKQWADGTSVRFIDRTAKSGLRKIFISEILKKTSEDVELYWIGQKLYTGNSAPLQEESEAMTMQFVASFPGAIGYILPTTKLQKDVKVVEVE